MSTSASIGYIDQSGNYRATAVLMDACPGDINYRFGRLFAKMNPQELTSWVETGIAGGGYDSLYNDESLVERGVAETPRLIDGENYDSSFLDYNYLVENGRVSFYDPKGIMGYDDDWLTF
jgi:hypothetical protein